MFYCPVCNSGIAVNVSKSFRILASAAISSKKFSIGSLSLTLVAKAGAPEFWCPTCESPVLPESIVCSCSQCGKKIGIKDSRMISGSGGIYCVEHSEFLRSEKSVVSLSDIISKIIIQA
jgi:hypothetical protein